MKIIFFCLPGGEMFLHDLPEGVTRTRELNRLVGGAYESQHTKGEAADLVIPEGPLYLLDLLETSGLDFDQAIVYRSRNFLHLSYRTEGNNRRQILHK